MKYLISPHDDDHALFTSFTCIREKPTVVVVLDSYIQPQRGEVGCSAQERALETEKSCLILGCPVKRFGIHDDLVTEEQVENALRTLTDAEIVYAPMVHHEGNVHHNMIARVAEKVFGKKLIQYPTYSKNNLYERGNVVIEPSLEEIKLKRSACMCYESQLRVNRPHFEAVVNQPEYHNRVLKKVFVITMFGKPFPWIKEFVAHVQHLEAYGWYWKIFAPANPELVSKGNVEFVPMECEDFNDLVEKKTGVRSNFYLTEDGRPSVHVTDYYVASGVIFEDYLKDADFWGITNLDVVYGRLDHWIPDGALQACDIFSDDTDSFNGVFALLRNNEKMNNFFKRIPDWQMKFGQLPCQKCIGAEGATTHSLYGTDEYDMSAVAKKAAEDKEIVYQLLNPFPFHSHDRLEQHVPDVKLRIANDGSLWELFADTNPPQWIHARPFFGREIAYFHFIRTKEWPKSLSQ